MSKEFLQEGNKENGQLQWGVCVCVPTLLFLLVRLSEQS